MSDEVSYPLHEAAASGDIDALNRFLEDGADVESGDSDGQTPLMRAARNIQLIAARHLLKWGACIERATSMGMTALTFSAARGHLDMVRLLIVSGADPSYTAPPKLDFTASAIKEIRDSGELRGMRISAEQIDAMESQRTPGPNALECAARAGHEEIVRLLLASGANPNPQTSGSRSSALSAAVQGTNTSIVKLLLEGGAEIDAQSGRISRRSSSRRCAKSCPMAKILLEAGANPNRGNLPPLAFAVNNRDIDMIRLLLAFGADPEHEIGGHEPIMVMARSKPEIAALFARHKGTDWHDAVRAGDLEETRARLDSGANINALNSDYDTALTIAATTGNLEMLSLILESGARVDEKNKVQSTALTKAASRGQEDVVRVLIAHGASLDISDKWGGTALYRAAAQEHPTICALLIDAGAHFGLFEAAVMGDIARISMFLADGVAVEQPNSAGMTPLMGAAAAGNLEAAILLHEHGADASKTDDFGNTALHHAVDHAVKHGSTGMLAALLEWGADIHARNELQESVLRAAVRRKSAPIVAFLLDNGADPNERLALIGRTLLEDAVLYSRGDPGILDLLLDRGVDIDATDNFGRTVLVQTLKLSPRLVAAGFGDDCENLRRIVRRLVERGAIVNARDMQGSALNHAVRSGDIEIVRILLDAGADLSGTEYDRALTIAANGSPDMVEFLRERGPTGGDKDAIKRDHILGLIDDLAAEPVSGPKLDRLLQLVKEVNKSKGNF